MYLDNMKTYSVFRRKMKTKNTLNSIVKKNAIGLMQIP